MKCYKSVLLLIAPMLLVGCNKGQTKEYLTLWNDCSSVSALKAYIKDVTNKNSKNFIPVEDRIATFDMDGTFVGELYPTYFEYNLLEYRALDDPTYTDKDPYAVETATDIRNFVRYGKALPKYDADHGFDLKHAHGAANAYAGMTVGEFDKYVKDYAKKNANGFKNMTYANSFYKPMLEVFKYLEANDFTYYVVSGSDRFICRALVDSIGIQPNRVIGMDVTLKSDGQGDMDGVNYTRGVNEDMIRTNELIIKNLKTNKVKQILQEVGKTPVLSFGNSGGDAAMHNFALGNKQYKSAAFMLVADDDVRDHARKQVVDGEIVRLENDAEFKARIDKLNSDWGSAGYNIISMKNDFKTIYGENVTKVDFSWN